MKVQGSGADLRLCSLRLCSLHLSSHCPAQPKPLGFADLLLAEHPPYAAIDVTSPKESP